MDDAALGLLPLFRHCMILPATCLPAWAACPPVCQPEVQDSCLRGLQPQRKQAIECKRHQLPDF